MNFAQKFRALRKSKKLTQAEAAELLGVHRRTVWVWESGTSAPASEEAILKMLKEGRLNSERGVLVGECYSYEGVESLYYKNNNWTLYKLNDSQAITPDCALEWLEERGKIDAIREYFDDFVGM